MGSIQDKVTGDVGKFAAAHRDDFVDNCFQPAVLDQVRSQE